MFDKEAFRAQWRKSVDKFWQLLEESVLVQSTVTLIAFIVTAALVWAGRDVPKEWWTVMGIIVGFWFGSKVQIAEKKASERQKEMAERIVSSRSKEC